MILKKEMLEKYIIKYRYTFLIAVIVGIFTYTFTITNYLPTWDSLYDLDINWRSQLFNGRYTAGLIAMLFTTTYDLPWVGGCLSILFMAFTDILIIDILEIKSSVGRTIASVLFMVFPTMAATFNYGAWTTAYMVAYFMSILAVYIVIRTDNWKIVSISSILFCISLGVYQIYYTTAAVCFLYYVILLILKNSLTVKEVLKRCIKVVK